MISEIMIYKLKKNKLHDYFLVDSMQHIRECKYNIYIDFKNYPIKIDVDTMDEKIIIYMLGIELEEPKC